MCTCVCGLFCYQWIKWLAKQRKSGYIHRTTNTVYIKISVKPCVGIPDLLLFSVLASEELQKEVEEQGKCQWLDWFTVYCDYCPLGLAAALAIIICLLFPSFHSLLLPSLSRVLPSWFLLLCVRHNAAAVSPDLSFDWLHYGLENEGVWRRECKSTNREEVWRGFRVLLSLYIVVE